MEAGNEKNVADKFISETIATIRQTLLVDFCHGNNFNINNIPAYHLGIFNIYFDRFIRAEYPHFFDPAFKEMLNKVSGYGASIHAIFIMGDKKEKAEKPKMPNPTQWN